LKGNCKKNPDIIKDSTLEVQPCKNGNIICNLEPGEYTLIFAGNTNNSRSILFSDHLKSSNDYAQNALNLGEISGTLNTSGELLSCHTSSTKTDPYAENSIIGLYDSIPIPFPDIPNFKRQSYSPKNIWYTFTLSGNKKI